MCETIESRAIILKMRRKLKGEIALNIRRTPVERFATIKRQLARWADDNASAFSQIQPVMQGLSNRDADNYEPLLAIAQLAGGDWVKHIENACLKLMEHASDNKSIGEELLEACRDAFDTLKLDKIFTHELMEYLLKDEEAVFATYNRGKPIAPRQVSKRLSEYGIKSKDIRRGYEVKKGYDKSQFSEAWKVYLEGDNLPQNATKNDFSPLEGILSATTLQTTPHAALRVADNTLGNATRNTNATPKPAPVLDCSVVADRKGESSEILKKPQNVAHKRGFSNAVIEAQNQSNSIGISDAELLKQFEREFLKTGTDGGAS